MQKIPMTVSGMQGLRRELDQLVARERPAIAKAIGEARAHGDLKENAEYHAAKEKQGLIEARIRDIEHKLAYAQVIDVTKLPRNGVVVFGTTVQVLVLETDSVGRYQLVGDDEASPEFGKISINSPIARSLIGKKVDDVAVATTPSGTVEMQVTGIEYV